MKKIISTSLLVVVGSLAVPSGWCTTCYVTNLCEGYSFKAFAFCGAYDWVSPQKFIRYEKRQILCPQDPEDPIVEGEEYQTTHQLGYVCIPGSDCY